MKSGYAAIVQELRALAREPVLSHSVWLPSRILPDLSSVDS